MEKISILQVIKTIHRRSAIFLLFISWSAVRAQLPLQVMENTIADFTEKPRTKWIFKNKASFFASPVVSDGLVYIGGLDSTFHVIAIDSGKEKWIFRTRGEIRSSALIHGSTVYLNGGDGSLYALDKRNGKHLWVFQAKCERKYDFADYFHSTPVINAGILYFGSGDGNFYAINAESGRLIWSFTTGNIVHTTAAINNGRIFFGSFDGYVYALNLKDGELLWKFKTVGHKYFPAGEVQGSPAVFNKLVFIGARDYNVYAIDQEKGYCHWNKAFKNGWGLNNNIHDSVLYTGSADERILTASDPATGREFWRKNMEFLIFGNNAYSKTMLYVGTTIGKVHGISLLTGENIWSFETGSYTRNRDKYFKPDDSYRDDIYSIIRSNEQFLDVECELGGFFSTPWIENDIILVASSDGTLYCLGR
jgi:outer membrane protein assembly factor BamB